MGRVWRERQEWDFPDHEGVSWMFQLNILTFLVIRVFVQIWLLPVDLGRHGEGESGDSELTLGKRHG